MKTLDTPKDKNGVQKSEDATTMCYIALIILALDMINRVPLLFYAFNNDWNRGICLLIGLLFKIILMIVVACYMRVLKET